MQRLLLAGAAWGPATFIGCWVVGGLTTPGYSAIAQPISDLAAVGAPTRGLMNVGLAAFALGIGGASWPLRQILGGEAAICLAGNAVMTLGVLATPLDLSPTTDTLHALFAGGSYISLTAVGLLAARHRFSKAWLEIGLLTGAALALSATDLAPGLFQRIGLTTTDLALMGTAVSALREVGAGQPKLG